MDGFIDFVNNIKYWLNGTWRGVRTFFEKIVQSNEEYVGLLQGAHLWALVKGAFDIDRKVETVDVMGGIDNAVLTKFPYSETYTITIDAKKIRDLFFQTDLHVNVVIKE